MPPDAIPWWKDKALIYRIILAGCALSVWVFYGKQTKSLWIDEL